MCRGTREIMDTMDMLWETYDGQDSDDFDFIGAVGHELEPITDADAQAAEMQRKYGKDIEVRIYKE